MHCLAVHTCRQATASVVTTLFGLGYFGQGLGSMEAKLNFAYDIKVKWVMDINMNCRNRNYDRTANQERNKFEKRFGIVTIVILENYGKPRK